MKKSIYKSYDELPLMLNMKQLSDLLGISDASAYELVQEEDFPSLRIGKRIVPLRRNPKRADRQAPAEYHRLSRCGSDGGVQDDPLGVAGPLAGGVYGRQNPIHHYGRLPQRFG